MSKKKIAPVRPYTVIVLECPHCGEEVYLIKSCDHCGAEGAMRFKEHKHFTKKELEEFYDEQNGEIEGDVKAILRSDEEEKEDSTDSGDSDIPPFGEDDMMSDDLSLEEL